MITFEGRAVNQAKTFSIIKLSKTSLEAKYNVLIEPFLNFYEKVLLFFTC